MTQNTMDPFGFYDFQHLYAEAVRNATSGARFVEVGCLFGKSTAFLATEILNSRKRIDLFAVDPWTYPIPGLLKSWLPAELHDGDPYAMFLANMADAGVAQLIQAVRDFSVAAAQRFEDGSLDFVFIDADHAYAAASAVLEGPG